MSDSEEEEFSDGDIEDIFGESEDEEEFEGFNFQLPDVMEWVVDDDGSVTRAFYERNPGDQFRRDHVGPTINSIPYFPVYKSNWCISRPLFLGVKSPTY